jgi:hypothetical protein
MGVTKKMGGSSVDTSMRELQCAYFITVAGSKRKTSKQGEPYGWPSCIYEAITSWVPASWLTGISAITPEEAREAILDCGMRMGKFSSREELAAILSLRVIRFKARDE